jgi:hypothetical protein
MPCGSRSCGCAISSSSLSVSGSGQAGDPWVLETYEAVATEFPDTRPGPGDRFVGMRVYATDTERLFLWKSSGWVILEEPWNDYTPSLTGVTLGTGGVVYSRYQRRYKRCSWRGQIHLGVGGALTAGPAVSTPVTGVTSASGSAVLNAGEGTLRLHDYGTTFGAGIAIVATSTMSFTAQAGPGTWGHVSPTSPWTWAENDDIYWDVEYETA